jgi:hypothetical protein
MSNARKRVNGNHVSYRGAPFFSRAWGTSRFSTPLPAHRLETSR